MKYLFTPSNMKFLESLAFTNTLFTFDFDGTLSKIVKHPDDAKINSNTKQLFDRLSKLTSVAVVSGRGLKDLEKRLQIKGVTLIGNHGIEGFDSNEEQLTNIQNICKRWYNSLQSSWVHKIRDPYVDLEDKRYSLSLHYRRSRKKRRAREAALKAIQQLEPKPRIIYGKCVINIMPADCPDKGGAILKLLERSKFNKVFYIGDDDTDEFVFGLNDVKVFSVRVGHSRSSKALFYIKNQAQVNKLLSSLIKILSSPKKLHGGQNYERASHVR